MEVFYCLFGIVAIGLGWLAIADPRAAWYFFEGWKFKHAEPSNLALMVTRIGGVTTFLILIGMLFLYLVLPWLDDAPEIAGPISSVLGVLYFLFGVKMMLFCLLALFKPRLVWYVYEGWQFKDLEPSDAVLIVIRMGGGWFLILGAMLTAATWPF